MQRRASKICGSILPNKRRGREQYILGQYDTVQSTTSLAVVVLFLTICIGPCQCQTVDCAADFAADSAGICQEIPVCPLEFPQNFYTKPGSVLAVPEVPAKTVRVDTIMASSTTQSYVMSLRCRFAAVTPDKQLFRIYGNANPMWYRMQMSCGSGSCGFSGPQWPGIRFYLEQFHIVPLGTSSFSSGNWHDLTVWITPNRIVIWLNGLVTVDTDHYRQHGLPPPGFLYMPISFEPGAQHLVFGTSLRPLDISDFKIYNDRDAACSSCRMTGEPLDICANCRNISSTYLCRCRPGHTGPSSGACIACVAGKYKSGFGSAPCVSCSLLHMESPAQSTSVNNCVCKAGFSLSDAQIDGAPYCTPCSAGKYKARPGNETCTECDPHSTSNENSVFLADCVCNAGYLGGNSGTCTACPAGTYRPASDGEVCTNCPEFLQSREGSTMITNCVCNVETPTANNVTCTIPPCAAGSTGPSPDQCVLCVVGKYKNSTGGGECKKCEAGKYSSVLGAASDVCQPCPVTVYSPEGSSSQDACVCGVAMSQKVYVLPTITCTGGCPCPGAPQQSNGEMRSQSPKIHWYDPPTRYARDLSCIWTIVADRPISLTFSEFSVGPAWAYEYAGYGAFLNIYTCTSAACSSRTLAESFTTLSRPPTTLLTSNIIQIHFITGHEMDTGWVMQWSIASLASMPMLCEWCEKGKFKSSTGSAGCTHCEAGKYSLAVGAVSGICQSCPGDKIAPSTTENVCLCRPGTYNDAVEPMRCNICPVDTYSTFDSSSSNACEPCGNNAYAPEGSTSLDACVCGTGTSNYNLIFPSITCSGNCPCPATPQELYGEIRSNNAGSTYVRHCDCVWTIVANMPISITFSEVKTHSATFDAVFIFACTDISCSSSTQRGRYGGTMQNPFPILSDISNTIQIRFKPQSMFSFSGFAMQWSVAELPISACEWCVAGKFKDIMGSSACSVCSNASTVVRANSDSCQACPANSGNLATTHGNCVCDQGFVSNMSSVTSNLGFSAGSGIYCNDCPPGKYASNTELTCINCEAGKYAAAPGSPLCTACHLNSISAIASDEITDCMCNVGYTGTWDTLCSVCTAGTYKSSIGSGGCENCPLNMDAFKENNSAPVCACNAGFSGVYGSCV